MQDSETLIRIAIALALYGGFSYSILVALFSLKASFWPKVRGEINYAGLLRDYNSETITYKPVIEFSYSVKGRKYNSDRFAIGFMASSLKFLSSSIYKKYRNRPQVKVSYNPKNPKSAVLITGIRSFHVIQIGIFAALIVVFNEGRHL